MRLALSRLKYGWGVGRWNGYFLSNGFYRLLNVNSGSALDVNGSSTANGAGIIQWPQNGGNNQQWIITNNGGGYYKITNRNSTSRLMLTAHQLPTARPLFNGHGMVATTSNGSLPP
jgi:endoglucanase